MRGESGDIIYVMKLGQPRARIHLNAGYTLNSTLKFHILR